MRDLNTYLTELSQKLIVGETQDKKILSSYDNLEGLLFKEFRAELDTVSRFGSYDRGTAFSLPNNEKSFDVDILITFKKDEFQPQTYLNKIKNLGQKIYPRSGVSADFPTVAIEMNHVLFELVPAIKTGNGTEVKIPAPRGNEEKWIETDPEKFKKKLLERDNDCDGMIIPLIKLAKYWNKCNGDNFYSFYFEEFIIRNSYPGCDTIREYFFEFISDLGTGDKTDAQKKLISEIKERKRRLKVLEEGKVPEYIEPELNSFIPMING